MTDYPTRAEEAEFYDRLNTPDPAPEGFTDLITDAHESYDGFGTKTVELAPFKLVGLERGQLRRVRVPNQTLQWQIQRYASGLHLRVPMAEFQQWIDGGQVVPVGLTDEQKRSDENRRAAIAFAEAAHQVLVQLREQWVNDEPSEGLRAAAAGVAHAIIDVGEYLGVDDLGDRVSLEAWEGYL